MTDLRGKHFSEDELYDYAMGEVDGNQAAAMRTHLAGCADCSRVVHETRVALSAFSFALPLETPAASLRQRTLNQIELAGASAAAPQRGARTQSAAAPPRESAARWFSPAGWMWAAAAAAACATVLLAVTIHLHGRVDDLQQKLAAAAATSAQAQAESAQNASAAASSRKEATGALSAAQAANAKAASGQALAAALNAPDTARFVLTAVKKHPQPQIRALYRASTGQVWLSASALPPLPPGKAYELWWLGKPTPTAAGLLHPDSSGSIDLLARDMPPNLPLKGFAVTVEAASGSDVPTSPVILVSN